MGDMPASKREGPHMAKKDKTKTQSGLSTKHIVGYGCGDLGGCMTFALMGSIVTRYYTNVLEVDTAVLATLLVVWNVWDAINDPLVGALMDKMYAKKPDKRGRFRPWLLRSAPLLCIASICFWILPTFFDGIAMIIVLFACKIFYEGMYTFFNIPMGSMLSAMAGTDNERSTLSSARGFGSMIGNVLPLVIMPQILAAYGDTSFAFGLGGTVCAIIGFIFCLLHYYWTEERFDAAYSSDDKSDDVKFTDIFGVFKHNRAFVALCIHGICICTMQYVNSTLGTYIYADVFGDVGAMSYSSLLTMVFGTISLLAVPKLTEKFELTTVIRACLLIAAALFFVLFGFTLAGMLNPWVYMIWSGLAMGFGGVSIYMQWGLVAEATDYNEMVTGKRSEGTIYGTFNLARRTGQTIGNSAAVLALGWIGYDSALAATGAVQTASVQLGIEVLCIIVPAIFMLGSWIAFKFVWNITPEVRAQIAANKDAAAEAAEAKAEK